MKEWFIISDPRDRALGPLVKQDISKTLMDSLRDPPRKHQCVTGHNPDEALCHAGLPQNVFYMLSSVRSNMAFPNSYYPILNSNKRRGVRWREYTEPYQKEGGNQDTNCDGQRHGCLNFGSRPNTLVTP